MLRCAFIRARSSLLWHLAAGALLWHPIAVCLVSSLQPSGTFMKIFGSPLEKDARRDTGTGRRLTTLPGMAAARHGRDCVADLPFLFLGISGLRRVGDDCRHGRAGVVHLLCRV